jgi:hypothetical protein
MPKLKSYNTPDRLAARQARRDAVMYLRTKKGYSWRVIGYALGTTAWPVECLFYSEVRRRGDKHCQHQWTQGALKLLTGTYSSLTCQKCGRIEYLNADRKWTEAKKGTVKYSHPVNS